jgi:hypothetical protein
MTAAATARVFTPALAEYLKPYQNAIGRKGGAKEIHKLIKVYVGRSEVFLQFVCLSKIS